MTASRGIRPGYERHGFTPKGQPFTPEYRAWKALIERCENAKCKAYKNYGGRGVRVAPEWRKSFTAFLSHIGARPSVDHSIDRFPNKDGNYEPGNVRWATRSEQNRNRRGLRLLTFRGETLCAVQWAERLGISSKALWSRIRRGWTVERALETPQCR